MCGSEDWSLKHSNEETHGVELRYVSRATLSESHDSPEDFEGREEPSGEVWAGDEEETGDLEEDVSCEVADVEIVEFVAVEVEIFF